MNGISNDFINWTKEEVVLEGLDKNLISGLFLGPPNFDGYHGNPEFEGFKVII